MVNTLSLTIAIIGFVVALIGFGFIILKRNQNSAIVGEPGGVGETGPTGPADGLRGPTGPQNISFQLDYDIDHINQSTVTMPFQPGAFVNLPSPTESSPGVDIINITKDPNIQLVVGDTMYFSVISNFAGVTIELGENLIYERGGTATLFQNNVIGFLTVSGNNQDHTVIKVAIYTTSSQIIPARF